MKCPTDDIEEGFAHAVDVLRKNSTSIGFSASTEKHVNYYSVWARDHSICAISALLTKDDELITTAKNGILMLLRKQIDHGQLPTYVEIENRKKVYGGLGVITSIDTNMWVPIAAAMLYKKTNDKRFLSNTNIERYMKLYRLYKAFDSNDCGLVEVHKAGDWADVFNRTYHVLYDECLYYLALRALMFLFKEKLKQKKLQADYSKQLKKRIRWISKRKPRVKRKLNELFWFTKDNISKVFEEYMIYDKIPKKEYGYYQSHLMPFKIQWSHRCDIFGNVLAMLSDIANKDKKRKIIKHVLKKKANEPFPVRCMDPPVKKKDIDWQKIYEFKEQPYMYHNGGIWPMVAGFWINALARNGKTRKAEEDLKKLTDVLKKQDWKFHEYMHGRTGKPFGREYQAWSAAGYIIAYHSVYGNVNLFDF